MTRVLSGIEPDPPLILCASEQTITCLSVYLPSSVEGFIVLGRNYLFFKGWVFWDTLVYYLQNFFKIVNKSL